MAHPYAWRSWYSGVVTSWEQKGSQHHVLYDDGVSETLSLHTEATKIYQHPNEETLVKEYSMAGKCFLCLRQGRLLIDVVDGTRDEPACLPVPVDGAAPAASTAGSSSGAGGGSSAR